MKSRDLARLSVVFLSMITLGAVLPERAAAQWVFIQQPATRTATVPAFGGTPLSVAPGTTFLVSGTFSPGATGHHLRGEMISLTGPKGAGVLQDTFLIGAPLPGGGYAAGIRKCDHDPNSGTELPLRHIC
jgi:hypothetical protein